MQTGDEAPLAALREGLSVRPGLVLHYIGDPFRLWEVATRSRPEDLQFHLRISGGEDEPKSQIAARDTPLLDLTALLVLDSLELFDKLFSVFRRIAITAPQIAAKLAQLAEWNVGIVVGDRYLIASLFGAVPDGFSGDASRRVEAFQANSIYTTLSRAIWYPGKSANELVAHMAHLLDSMLQSQQSDVDSVAAVLASWFIRVRMLHQTKGPVWHLVCYPVLLVLKATPDEFCGRLIGVLQRAVAVTVGERTMSVNIEGEIARELGSITASLVQRDSTAGGELLRKLLLAMPLGTANGDHCMDGYTAKTRLSTIQKA